MPLSTLEFQHEVAPSRDSTHRSRRRVRGPFLASVKRPAAQQRIGKLMEPGLQTHVDLEKRLNDYTGKLGGSSN